MALQVQASLSIPTPLLLLEKGVLQVLLELCSSPCCDHRHEQTRGTVWDPSEEMWHPSLCFYTHTLMLSLPFSPPGCALQVSAHH